MPYLLPMKNDNDNMLQIRRETLLASIAEAGGGRMARLDRILDAMATDPGVLEGLSPSEFYFLLKDIGPRDASPLLVRATDEQLSRIVDFDAWEGQRYSPTRFTAWLELAKEESDAVALRMLRAVDPEVLALQIMSQSQVVEVDKTPEQVDIFGGRDEVFQTPDREFWIICIEGADTIPDMKGLVDQLYEADLEWARDLLKASAWELVSSLEDEALRFRTARLSEEGFPSPEEAEQIYKIIDIERLEGLLEHHADRLEAGKSSAKTRALWDLGGVEGFRESFLTRCLASMRDGPRKVSVVRSLAHLLGEVVMAETRGDFGDGEGAARAPARLHGLVSAGLEHLGAESPEDGAGLLRRLHPRILFRVGYTLLLGVRGRARECLRRAGAAKGFRLLDEAPWGDAIAATAAFVPQVLTVVDGQEDATLREVRGLGDIQGLRLLVKHAKARLDFVIDVLGAGPEALEEWLSEEGRAHVTCTTLVSTALLDALVDLPTVTPLTPAQLTKALDLWMPWDVAASKRIPDETLHAALADRLGAESAAVRGLFEDAAKRLRTTFEGLEPGHAPDPRFLGAAVIIGETTPLT